MAPRATRLRVIDDSSLAFSLPRTPGVAVKSILRGGASQSKRQEKKVSFGDVETKEVERWIGIVQVCWLLLHWLAILTDTSTRALSPPISCSTTKAGGARGDSFMSSPILTGAEDDSYHLHLYGQVQVSAAHLDCPNSSCNRRILYQQRQ